MYIKLSDNFLFFHVLLSGCRMGIVLELTAWSIMGFFNDLSLLGWIVPRKSQTFNLARLESPITRLKFAPFMSNTKKHGGTRFADA